MLASPCQRKLYAEARQSISNIVVCKGLVPSLTTAALGVGECNDTQQLNEASLVTRSVLNALADSVLGCWKQAKSGKLETAAYGMPLDIPGQVNPCGSQVAAHLSSQRFSRQTLFYYQPAKLQLPQPGTKVV